jgi:hypothetical protein
LLELGLPILLIELVWSGIVDEIGQAKKDVGLVKI